MRDLYMVDAIPVPTNSVEALKTVFLVAGHGSGPEATKICLCPQQVDNSFIFICQMAPVLACWLFKASATS